jgi:hypothetical protein
LDIAGGRSHIAGPRDQLMGKKAATVDAMGPLLTSRRAVDLVRVGSALCCVTRRPNSAR